METLFQPIQPEAIQDNIFKLIGKDWMLLSAGKPDDYNIMTASWGCAGVLWRKPVAFVFVRPQRHTFPFMESQSRFALSFFDENHRDLLNLCGTTSGRDLNKMDIDGLDPVFTPDGSIGFQQARLIMECRKIYYDDIKPEFFQVFDIEKVYPSKDYHRMYVGEITQVWQRK